MAFESFEDRVILKLDHSDKVTDAGIVLPQLREHPNRGVVVAAGPGRTNTYGVFIPVEVEVGDEVLFERGMASGVKLEGEEYVTVPAAGILGIFRD
jgi:chaperonin GroES